MKGVLFRYIRNVNLFLQMYKQKHLEGDFVREKLKFYQKEFDDIHLQFKKCASQFASEKKLLNEKISNLEKQNSALVESIDVSEAKLKEYIFQTNMDVSKDTKAHHSAELAANIVVLNRKSVYLECENNNLEKTIKQLKIQLLNTKNAFSYKICKMSRRNKFLANKLSILENTCKTHADVAVLQKTQETLDNINLKYRILQQEYQNFSIKDNLSIDILNESVKHLQNEKAELLKTLTYTMTKLYLKSAGGNEEILASKLAETEINEITERQRANHINNLYELVKEQLKKSEERFSEVEVHNREIMQKNTILQQKLNNLQDKIINNIDIEVFKEIQSKCNNLLKENSELSIKNEKLLQDAKNTNKKVKAEKLFMQSQEYECLNLKHQLIDLQAVSEDKAIIARLSSDLLRARLSEATSEKRIQELLEENQELEQRSELFENLLCEEIEKNKENLKQPNRQIW